MHREVAMRGMKRTEFFKLNPCMRDTAAHAWGTHLNLVQTWNLVHTWNLAQLAQAPLPHTSTPL